MTDHDELTALLARLDAEDADREARLAAPDALLNAALYYAANGWPVFPLAPRGKRPITSRGFHDATTDLGQIRAWWHATPAANIGTPTGLRFDVVDVDGPRGYASLSQMRHAGCAPDCCATTVCHAQGAVPDALAKVHTGRGGQHIYITPLGAGNGTAVLPGIDMRGLGGYVVLPPSIHENGKRYAWIDAPTPALLEAAA